MLMPSRALARHTSAHTKHFRTTHAALYKAAAALIACAALLAPSFVTRRAEASTTADVRGASAETARNTKATGVRPAQHDEGRGDASKRAAINSAYGRLPVAFIANGGQLDPSVAFSACGAGYQLFLTDTGAVLALDAREDARDGDGAASRDSGAVLHMNLMGARRATGVSGERPLEGKAHYFVGSDPSKWRTNVATYSAVRYEGVYPGVSLVYYGDQRQLEYDFRVSPHADPRQIKIDFDGARSLKIDREGRLFVRVGESYVTQRKPVAYQLVGGERRQVSARYHVNMRGEVSFRLGRYDHALPLVIDPVISYATYLGGSSADQANGVAVDSAGNAYVVGQTVSANFPTAGALQPARGGTSRDAFVTKLNPAGTALVYSTFLGGSLNDTAYAVAVDAAGNAYVTGSTFSTDFPHTAGALQQSNAGGGDAFVAKLSAAGDALVYSTFLGGVSGETGYGVGVDAAGNAYVAGAASSPSIGGVALPKRGSPAYKSADAGANWSAVKNGVTDPAFNAITVDPTNGSTLYAAGSVVFKSTDGGATWAATPPLVVSPTLNATPNSVAVDPAAPSTLYAATAFGVYKSTDAGANWSASSNGLSGAGQDVIAVLVDPSNHSTLYAGTLNGVFKSTDGGANWAAANTGMTFSPPEVLKLAFDPTNTATIYIATTRGVAKSTNAAASWGAPANFNGMPIVSLVVDPSAHNTVYAASRLGVSKSTDGGANWSSSSNGLTVTSEGTTFNVGVNALAINPLAPATLYAATYVGVFKSTDGGANWSPADNGLANMTVNDIAVDRTSPANVYAATSSGGEAFAAKLNPAGTALGYIVYLGGDEDDSARGVAVDATGNAYVAGTTGSANFPVASAAQPGYGGGGDAFVTKLATDGSLVYSTYLGGGNFDGAAAVAVDPAGRAYVTGDTLSANFPVTATRKPHDPTFYDAFVARLNPAGSALDYSFLFGGSDMDEGFGVAADAAGNAYVTGYTGSFADFPLVNATQTTYGSAFALKINADGSVGYSTYLGGPGGDQGLAIAADQSGAAYVAGKTVSSGFPVTSSAFQRTYGGSNDAFVARIGNSADLSLTLAGSFDPVLEHDSLTYTISITNAGPDKAPNAKLTDTLPAGVTFVSANSSRGSCANAAGVVTCGLSDLDPGAGATVQIVVTAPSAPATLSDTAGVTSDTGDANPADNTGTLTTHVSAQPSIAGHVTLASGAPITGTAVALSGSQSATRQTDARGSYQFSDLARGGSYAVAPSKAGYVFHPQSQSFSNLSADQTADFTGVRCTFTLSALNQSFDRAGGAGTVNVTADDGLCQWAARSNAPWITINSGGGAGDGAVSFTVAPATNSSRSGTLTIAGQTFTVWQGVSPCAAPSFSVAQRVPVAGTPYTFASADFNGDGLPDLAMLNDSPRSVAVRLGNAAGGFGAPASYNIAGGFANRFVVAADVNKDGRPDLIIGNSGGGISTSSILIMLNDGAGGFGAPQSFAAGADPYAAAVADFNGDGNPDLAVANSGSNNVSMLMGDGAGHFAAPANYGNFPNPGAVAAADLNGDGKPDVIAQSVFGLVVMLGDGQGHLGAQSNNYRLVNLGEPNVVVVADFNRDGKPDVAAENSQGLAVLLGNGDGTLGAASSITLGPGVTARALVAADFNFDGKPDLAAVNSTGVTVLTGDGQGNFGVAPLLHTGPFPRSLSLAAGDFNHDGLPDLMTLDSTTEPAAQSDLVIIHGTPSGGFDDARDFPVAGTFNLDASATADFDGDGKLDLAVAGGSAVSVMRGDGAGGFGAAANFATGSTPVGLVVADFNRDGRPDLATANYNSNSVSVLINNGAGGFAPATSVAVGQLPRGIISGDFNGDGNPDLAVTDGSGANGHITILLGNGAGGFTASGVIVNPSPRSITAADVNGDGRQDLLAVVVNQNTSPYTGSLAFLAGNGAGGFAAPVLTALPQTNASAFEFGFNMIAGDFNGDGKPDVVLGYAATSSPYNGGVAVLDGDGQGGFGAPATYATGSQPRFITSGDFNGDGKPDLAVANWGSSTVSILTGRGTGGFDSAVNYAGSTYTSSVAAGDFNGDGRLDFAVTNYGTSFSPANVTVTLNACPGAVAQPTIQFGAPSFTVAEGAGVASLSVTRAGDTSPAASVGFATVDDPAAIRCDDTANNHGAAYARCDYATTVGTITFAPGETQKTISVSVIDDAYVEGDETFGVRLYNAQGAALGSPSTATVTIKDNDVAGGPNPILGTDFFVRMQYIDFLSREPEPGQPWSAVLNNCAPNDTSCDRVSVSGNFFRSQEFQLKGLFVFKFYKASFGRLPLYSEIVADMSSVTGTTDADLIAKKAAFTSAWAQRQEFTNAFGAASTQMFIDTLMNRYNLQSITTINPASPDDASAPRVTLSRSDLVIRLNAGTLTRGQVVRAMADSDEVSRAEFNPAFVAMQYFGYLRRDPESDGYNAWLRTINANPSDTRSMVNGFVNSTEYRLRFGQP